MSSINPEPLLARVPASAPVLVPQFFQLKTRTLRCVSIGVLLSLAYLVFFWTHSSAHDVFSPATTFPGPAEVSSNPFPPSVEIRPDRFLPRALGETLVEKAPERPVDDAIQLSVFESFSGWWNSVAAPTLKSIADTTERKTNDVCQTVEAKIKQTNLTQVEEDTAQTIKDVGETATQVEKDLTKAVRTGNWTVVQEKLKKLGAGAANVTEHDWLKLQSQLAAYKNAAEHPKPGSVKVQWSCASKVLAGAGVGVAAGVGVGVGVAALFPLFLSILGFGEAGVEAGTVAAKWQSTIGDVEAGSLFAVLTSIAMGGLSYSSAPFVLIPAGSLGAGSAIAVLKEVCKPEEYGIVAGDGDVLGAVKGKEKSPAELLIQ